jgi:uncharacterized 2Fe-2S/4Fe-4S cluster protein (DUF4445 family)
MADNAKFRVKVGAQTVEAQPGAVLMEALVAAGFLLRSDCGGRGRCGKCMVRVVHSEPGALSAAPETEREFLGADRLAAGYRLACCAQVFGEAAIEIPPESRLAAEVVQKGLPVLLSKLQAMPPAAFKSPSARYGLAIDVGTTTLAVYLCDRRQRSIVGSTSARNPQSIFGDDVISRIHAVRTDPSALPRLRKMTVSAIEWAMSALCRRFGVDPRAVGEMVAVGNSTMIHLLLGEDPSSIGVFPYTPRFSEDRIVGAGSIGLELNPSARLRTLPLISGYLGADIVSAALAADLGHRAVGTLLVDVGTNGEIIFLADRGLAATSCATGPAFEGACIRHGMQATSGAIDAVRFRPEKGRLDYTVIKTADGKKKKAAGICGSGVISVVAELLRAGVISKSGSYNKEFDAAGLRPGGNDILEFEIVPAGQALNSHPITFTQADVRAVQLAKGALRAGIDLLCRQNGMSRPQKILLAGAFGSYISRADALELGMFPEMPIDDIEVVGNAAGAGAVLALLDESCFERAREMVRTVRVLDLSAHPDFQNTFVAALTF